MDDADEPAGHRRRHGHGVLGLLTHCADTSSETPADVTPTARMSNPSPGPTAPTRRALGWALLATAVVAGAMFGVERRIHEQAVSQVRRDVGRRLDGYERALAAAISRRAAVLHGIVEWLRATDRDEEWGSFDEVAPVLAAGVDGLRTIQVVDDGIIRATWPRAGNEAALGLDLRDHPDPSVNADLQRAVESGRVVVSDPLELVQGGRGVIMRLTAGAPGDVHATVAAVVVSLDPLLADAGLTADHDSDLSLVLDDPNGRWVYGALVAPDDPVERTLPPSEGGWRLSAAPSGGWEGAVAARHRVVMAGAVFITLLVGSLVFIIAGRQASLQQAVAARTDQLARAMAELEAHEAFLSGALQGGDVMAWAWDVESESVERSGALSALDTHRFRGVLDDIRELIHPDDRERVLAGQAAALERGTMSLEYRLVRPEGDIVWVRDVARLVRDGPSPRLVGAMADVTRVKQLEQQLLHAQRLEEVGRLAAVVAHDFNNLLTVMQANLELAVEGLEGTPADDLDEVGRAIEHATFLTRKLLSFSRRDLVRPETLDVDGAVRGAVALVRPIMGSAARIDLEANAPGSRLRMDPGQLTQIVFNLAVNARDAMPEGGRIVVRTEVRSATDPTDSDAVQVIVEDDGTGIDPQALQRIFEPFVTTKGSEKGTGLGLSTVKIIAEGVGGTVEAENRTNGGARFTVTLPSVLVE